MLRIVRAAEGWSDEGWSDIVGLTLAVNLGGAWGQYISLKQI